MHVTINDKPVQLPDEEITVAELLSRRNHQAAGTAVAINNRLIPRDKHKTHYVKEGDIITIISAAFGG